jgi:predicted GNAT family acetyltransferase
MKFRKATHWDVDMLAEMNRQLIEDEGSRNNMTLPELKTRMAEWLKGKYEAVLFEEDGAIVAYALYRMEEGKEIGEQKRIYLRQLFVDRQHRRKGMGRKAVQILSNEIWPPQLRVVLEILVDNTTAHRFWQSVGFKDYAITLDLIREEN